MPFAASVEAAYLAAIDAVVRAGDEARAGAGKRADHDREIVRNAEPTGRGQVEYLVGNEPLQ